MTILTIPSVSPGTITHPQKSMQIHLNALGGGLGLLGEGPWRPGPPSSLSSARASSGTKAATSGSPSPVSALAALRTWTPRVPATLPHQHVPT